MNTKRRNFFISLVVTVLLGIFIFFINDSKQPMGASFGAFVKLQYLRIISLIAGLIVLVTVLMCRILNKGIYSDKLFYLFPGILNLAIGLYGVIYFSFNQRVEHFLHEFLLNLLIGVLICADGFLSRE